MGHLSIVYRTSFEHLSNFYPNPWDVCRISIKHALITSIVSLSKSMEHPITCIEILSNSVEHLSNVYRTCISKLYRTPWNICRMSSHLYNILLSIYRNSVEIPGTSVEHLTKILSKSIPIERLSNIS